MKHLTACAAMTALCLATLAPAPADALSDDQKKGLAALLALGVGIAAAKHGKDHNSTSQWDEDRYGKPFSPSAGVLCVPKQQHCFHDGAISWRWTRRIFGS